MPFARTFALLLLVAVAALADNLGVFNIIPQTGVLTVSKQWTIGTNLAGLRPMLQDLGLGGGSSNFYSLKSSLIPQGGDTSAFTYYVAQSGAATTHNDIGSKLTPDSYSALTSADPDIGYGSVNFYVIHHKGNTDYFTTIIPSSGTASSVTDLKPMSGPGGPATVTGVNGYFAMTFAAVNLGYGENLFYYLRLTGAVKFGVLAPALLATAADVFDLGVHQYKALVFTGDDIGYGVNMMYYLKIDTVTGFTVFGTLNPGTGAVADVCNLGSVFTTITYTSANLGFGSGGFYAAGAFGPTFQSISFAAITNKAISSGAFTVAPSASSGLPIVLTVVSGSSGAALISGPVGGVFTVSPTSSGVVTLQAAQAGSSSFAFNMLRQTFIVTTNPVATTGAPQATPVPTLLAPGATKVPGMASFASSWSILIIAAVVACHFILLL